jgi:DNA recombination protein RmuC
VSDSALILIIIGSAALLGAAVGWFAARLRASRRITELETTLTHERATADQRLESLEARFAQLSQQALKGANESFLQLAKESFAQLHTQASGDLEKRQQAVENLVKPIREALEKTGEQIHAIEKERQSAYGALGKQLESLVQTQQQLQGETRNLVQALRRPEVRGQWGEMTLKRVVEMAGMVEHCDFETQVSAVGEESRLRPDMVIHMPGGRDIVVDAKTPLDAYLNAIAAADEETRRRHLEHHARKVRERVRELAAKSYWSQFRNAPDFVVLFIPQEQFLSVALEVDPSLLEEALAQKVMLATPTNLVALLRAVAYGWRQEALAENTAHIHELGTELYNRLSTFSEHLAKLGRSLEGAVGDYNRAVGSFETKLLPGARKFPEMGVTGSKSLEEPEPIEKAPRPIARD